MKMSDRKEFELQIRCIDRKRNAYNLVFIHTFLPRPDLSDIHRQILDELSSLTSPPPDELPTSIREKIHHVCEQGSKPYDIREYYYEGKPVRKMPDGSFEIMVDGEPVIAREVPPSEFYNELMGRYSPFDD